MDFKHLKILHKPSNKIVSIFQFAHDATWKGKERDTLIAIPADTPKGIDEIEMSFTNPFKRYKGTNKEQSIYAFFKRKSGQPKTLSEKRVGGESEAHKLAKNEIYEKLFNGELTINGKTIYELGTKELDISEEAYSDTGHSIADVLVQFDEYPNHNLLYGLGINIEIQFSNQNESKTKERTLSRLRDGWSVKWLWRENFDSNGNLLLKDLKILPREKHLKELGEKECNDFMERINEGGILIDEKINSGKEEIKESIGDYKEEIYNLNEEIKESRIRDKEEMYILKEEIKELYIHLKTKIEKETEGKIICLTEKTHELTKEVLSNIKEEYSKCFEILENTKDGIDYEELKKKFLSKLSEDEKLLNDFGDIFIKIKSEQLMKEIKGSFPLQVREFFLGHVDDMLVKIYEDRFEDITEKLGSIKEEKDLYKPRKRLLVSRDTQIKLGNKNEKTNS